MLKHLRGALGAALGPVVRVLAHAGVSPDLVTLIGTIGVCSAALIFFPLGQLALGAILCGIFALFDALDGALAREVGKESVWGAYLDSTLDRVADAAVFGGLMWWFVVSGDLLNAGLAAIALVAGSLVSYAKARAEGVGCTANVGVAERADRLVTVLVAAGVVGFGVPTVLLTSVLVVLVVASTVTVAQRMMSVYQQTR